MARYRQIRRLGKCKYHQFLVIDRVLIVGFGSIGKKHLRNVRDILPKADIKIFSQSNKAEKISDGFFRDFNKALQFKPNIAIICSPANYHLSQSLKLIKQNCHLFIEKPLSNKLNNIEKLKILRDKFSLTVQIGYNLRFCRSIKYFKKMIDSNLVGKVFLCKCEVGKYLPSWRPASNYEFSVSAQKKLGGGVLLELSHEFDYLTWIFGEMKVLCSYISKKSNLNIDVEDNAILLMENRTKLKRKKITFSVNLDFIRHDITRSCIAIGENGSLKLDLIRGEVSVWYKNKKNWKSLFKDSSHNLEYTYKDEITSFINNIKNNLKPLVTLEDGESVMKIVENAKKIRLKNNSVKNYFE